MLSVEFDSNLFDCLAVILPGGSLPGGSLPQCLVAFDTLYVNDYQCQMHHSTQERF